MASKEVEIEESTSELKHLRFLKDIAVKFLVLLSNVYDFAKQNAGVLETKIVSVENAVVSAVRPVYNKLKDLLEKIIVFVDDKLEKYAPGLAKNLIAKFQSLIDKTIPLVEKLLTKAKTIVTPLITTAISLLTKLFKTIKSLLQKIIAAIKSLPLFNKAQALLEKGLNTIKSLPIVSTLKSIVARIPVIGNVAQHLIINPLDLVKLVKNSPAFGVAKNIIKQVETVGLKATLKSAYLSFNIVGPPVIAQFWYKANTYPVFESVAEVALPVVEKLSEYYNKLVKYMDGKGYEVFDYLPVLPIEEIKAAYKVVKMAMDSAAAVGNLAGDLTGLNNINNNQET